MILHDFMCGISFHKECQYTYSLTILITYQTFLLLEEKGKFIKSFGFFFLHFRYCKMVIYQTTLSISFWAQKMSSCFDSVTFDLHYNKSCQYCLTTCQYGKILHTSNMHNIIGLQSRQIIILFTKLVCHPNSIPVCINFYKTNFL